MKPLQFTILGEPASKANSRQAVPRRGKNGKAFVAFIKSSKAQEYVRTATPQIPICKPLLTGPLAIDITIYYASERPDLDPSLILDIMQGRVYANDRAVREMHLLHGIDKLNPRADIIITTLTPQQDDLLNAN